MVLQVIGPHSSFERAQLQGLLQELKVMQDLSGHPNVVQARAVVLVHQAGRLPQMFGVLMDRPLGGCLLDPVRCGL